MSVPRARRTPRRRALAHGARVAVGLCLLTALAGCGGARHAVAPPRSPVASSAGGGLYGLVPEPLPRKPDFTLTDTAGRPFNLVAGTRGKLTYLYFGYTHCPNACPVTMSALSYAIRLQPPAVRRRIAVVFVTVDPRRDTLAVLRAWLDHYSTSFIGLRGTMAQIVEAEQAAGVPPAPRVPEVGDYSVPHSSILFAYSPDELAHVVYATGFSPTDYAHDMPLLLRFTRPAAS